MFDEDALIRGIRAIRGPYSLWLRRKAALGHSWIVRRLSESPCLPYALSPEVAALLDGGRQAGRQWLSGNSATECRSLRPERGCPIFEHVSATESPALNGRFVG